MLLHSRSGLVSIALLTLVGTGGFYFFHSKLLFEGPPPLLVQDALAVPIKGFKLPGVKNKAFSSGEKLYYNIIFKGITVGHSTIEITDGPSVNGRPTLQYVSKAESTHFFDLFFKVRDKNVSTVDKDSLFSLSFDQDLNEGHYHAVRRYVFDYVHKKYNVEEKKKDKTAREEGPLTAPLFDVLSALYFVRTLDLSPGRDLTFSIYRDKGGKRLPIKIGDSLQSKKTPMGTFDCVRVEPLIKGDSIFKSKNGGLVVWMTNDTHKLPVLMEANASVGVVRVKLMKWEH